MSGTVGGFVMQGPINDPGFQPLGARSRRLAQMASPETGDAFLQKALSQEFDGIDATRLPATAAARLCPPAKPRMIRTRRTSSARRLWLRLMRFNSRRSEGLNLKGAGMKKIIHQYRQMSLLQCTRLELGRRKPDAPKKIGTTIGNFIDAEREDRDPAKDDRELRFGASQDRCRYRWALGRFA